MRLLRTAAVAALGLLVGGFASSLFTSCACPDTELEEVPPGVYVPAEGSDLPADYTFEVAESPTVVESFTHDGKAYVITYSYLVQEN